MKIAFLGHRRIAAGILRDLAEQGTELAAVVTHDPAAYPDETEWFETAEAIARRHQAPLLQPSRLAGSKELERLASCGADLWVVVGYLELLGAPMLAIPRHGAINFHAALLPRYRGRAPLSRALMNGEKTVGATVHYINEGMDAGDILLQETREVGREDTVATLYAWAMTACPSMMLRAVELVASGKATRRPQRDEESLAFAELTPRDRMIRWEWSAARVYDQVRALVRPWPGALTHYRGEELLVWAAAPPARNDTRRGADPGRILSTGPEGSLIATGEGEIAVTEVELVTRPGPVPAGTFFQRPGAKLGLDIEGRLLRLERRLEDLEREARPSR